MINLQELVSTFAKAVEVSHLETFPSFPSETDERRNNQLIDSNGISVVSDISVDFEDRPKYFYELYEKELGKTNVLSCVEYPVYATETTETTETLTAAASFFSVNKERVTERTEKSGAQPWRPSNPCEYLATLAPWSDPCPGFRRGVWRDARAIALRFAAMQGAEATALGWTDLELYGVHAAAGVANVSCVGALMLGREVTALEADRIRFGNLSFYRGKQGAECVPVWSFKHLDGVANDR